MPAKTEMNLAMFKPQLFAHTASGDALHDHIATVVIQHVAESLANPPQGGGAPMSVPGSSGTSSSTVQDQFVDAMKQVEKMISALNPPAPAHSSPNDWNPADPFFGGHGVQIGVCTKKYYQAIQLLAQRAEQLLAARPGIPAAEAMKPLIPAMRTVTVAYADCVRAPKPKVPIPSP